MTAHLITLIHDVTDPDRYARYTAAVPALVERHGGTYVVRSSHVEALEGHDVGRALVLRFPTVGAIHAMFADPDYLAIADLRREAASATIVVAEAT